jgi:hypothetical protein
MKTKVKHDETNPYVDYRKTNWRLSHDKGKKFLEGMLDCSKASLFAQPKYLTMETRPECRCKPMHS